MAKVGDIKVQPSKPGPGWAPVAQVGNSTNIRWRYVGSGSTASQKSTGSSGSSGGGSGSSGGGSGGTANEGLSQYVQAYRLNFFKNGSPPSDMVQRAKDNNWSVAYFLQRVRLEDKNYYKSDEARQLLPNFSRTMQVLFPGLANDKNLMKSPFYKKIALWYLKNGVGLKGKAGTELLYSKITNTKRWKQANPYWKQYTRNASPAVAAEANPLLYKAHLDTLKTAFKDYGMELPEDYYRSFFRSRYASQDTIGEMQDNLKMLAQGKGSFSWFQGRDMNSGETKQTIFGGDQQADLKNRLAKAFAVKSSFLGTEEKEAQTSVSEQNKLIRPML